MTAGEILAEVCASSQADVCCLQGSRRLQSSMEVPHCAISMPSHVDDDDPCDAESDGLFRVEGVQ